MNRTHIFLGKQVLWQKILPPNIIAKEVKLFVTNVIGWLRPGLMKNKGFC